MIFRMSIIATCLLLFGNSAYATPCAQLKSKPDTWVATKVNALVQAARRAYENDESSPPTSECWTALQRLFVSAAF